MHIGPFRYCTKLGAKRAEQVQLMQSSYDEVTLQFFTRNTHDAHHWTLNSFFGVFRSVWVYLGLFCYYTKLNVEWTELVQLMQKFVPQSPVRSFCNKSTRSTPSDPKLMLWCIFVVSGGFGIISLLHVTKCKTGWSGASIAKLRATKSDQNFLEQTHLIHPLDPKLMFCCVL